MPFGKRGEYGTKGKESEEKANDIYKLIKKSINTVNRRLKTRIRCERADDPPERGIIDKQLYEKLDQARIVIADLTGSNENVYYELGVRLALKERNTIVLTQDRNKIAFDLGHLRSKQYSVGSEQESEELTIYIAEQVEAIAMATGVGKVESPVYEFLPYKRPFSLHPSTHQLWRTLSSSRIQIVLGQYPTLRIAETTGVVGTGDALALGHVVSMLTLLNAQYEIVLSPNHPSSWRDNLVLIGGPGTNTSVIEIERRIKLDPWFGVSPSLRWGRERETVIYDREKTTEYCPERNKEGKLTSDVGLILFTRNPFNRDTHLLLLAGAWGAGTAGAALAVVHEPAITTELVKLSDPVVAVIRIPVVNTIPQRPYLAICRQLNRPERSGEGGQVK
jgi:hypothetical protein